MVRCRHDGEWSKPRTIDGKRVRAGVEAGDMKAAGSHRFNLCSIRLHREKHNILACFRFEMRQEI